MGTSRKAPLRMIAARVCRRLRQALQGTSAKLDLGSTSSLVDSNNNTTIYGISLMSVICDACCIEIAIEVRILNFGTLSIPSFYI